MTVPLVKTLRDLTEPDTRDWIKHDMRRAADEAVREAHQRQIAWYELMQRNMRMINA